MRVKYDPMLISKIFNVLSALRGGAFSILSHTCYADFAVLGFLHTSIIFSADLEVSMYENIVLIEILRFAPSMSEFRNVHVKISQSLKAWYRLYKIYLYSVLSIYRHTIQAISREAISILLFWSVFSMNARRQYSFFPLFSIFPVIWLV